MSKLKDLQAAMPALLVHQDADTCQRYAQDWTAGFTGQAEAVLFPTTTEMVQAIVKFANEHQVSLVPSGGRTGLSGGAVARSEQWVVSLDKMNAITGFDNTDRLLYCQAGVITQVVQETAVEKACYFPVDFASRGSSQIGGNVATNAGGIRVFRYGMLRDWVAGLTVVTGQGDILRVGKGLIKNATGYDLRHLFIGSEGTLGIITEVTLRLTTLSVNQKVLFLAVPKIEDIASLLVLSRQQLRLSAFEMLCDKSLQAVLQHHQARLPVETATPYYVLLEFDDVIGAEEQALSVFEQALEAGWALDGVISQNEQQAQQLWGLREHVGDVLAHHQPYKNDIAVKPSSIVAFLQDLETLLLEAYPDFQVAVFGHVADGNLHLNILKPEQMKHEAFLVHCQQVSHQVFALVQRHEGTISAEHGIGLLKQPYLSYVHDEASTRYLSAIKQVFDPNMILNPGKLLAND